jgi:hypothetical protein
MFLAAASSLRATTLVAVWTPERILLAADSRVVDDELHPGVDACKIAQSGGTYYAVAGLAEDPITGYRIDRLAERALGGAREMPEKLNALVALVRSPLQRAVDQLKIDSPDQYRWLQKGHPVLQLILAGQEHSAPSLAVAGFQLDADGAIHDNAKVIASASDTGGARLIYAGQQTQIRQYLAQHRDWSSLDGTELVKTLIKQEIDAGTGLVGGPVDILSLKATGAEWVQKKAGCSPF